LLTAELLQGPQQDIRLLQINRTLRVFYACCAHVNTFLTFLHSNILRSPRLLSILPPLTKCRTGTDTCQFKIKNSSTDDKILLFKIRRSEPKLLEYTPKCGIVEPGVTKNVTMQLVDAKVTFARVLVKLVAIKRDHLKANFADSWDIGAEFGVIKKVVDVKNLAFRGQLGFDDDAMSESMASEDIGGLQSPGAMSPAEGMMNSAAANRGSRTTQDNLNRLASSLRNMASPASVMSANQEEMFEVTEDMHCTPGKGISSIESTPNKNSTGFKAIDIPSIDTKATATAADAADGANVKDTKGGHADHEMVHIPGHAHRHHKDSAVAKAYFASQEAGKTAHASDSGNLPPSAATEFQFQAAVTQESSAAQKVAPVISTVESEADAECRRLVNQFSRTEASRVGARGADDVVVKINGANSKMTNEIVQQAARTRCIEAFHGRTTVAVVDIAEAGSVTSFSKAFGSLFDEDKASEVESMRALMIEGSLKHLLLNGSTMRVLDSSINRFSKLTSLDLSGNELTSIQQTLQLPLLQRLDLSRNKLTALHALECLSSLKVLNMGHNQIKTLSAVNVLVPLGSSISSVTFTGNPIATDTRYAAYVISAFQKLVIFDGRDLQTIGSRTLARGGSGAGAGGSYSGGTPRGKGTPMSKSFVGAPALPEEMSNSFTAFDDATGEAETKEDKEFERRLKHALNVDKGHVGRSQELPQEKIHPETTSAPKFTATDAGQRVPFSPALSLPLNGSISKSGPQSAQKAVAGLGPATKVKEFSSHLTAHTTANRGRRMSQKAGMLEHMAAHAAQSKSSSPTKSAKDVALRSLTAQTALQMNRRRSFGMNTADLNASHMSLGSIGEDDEVSGYNSDPGGQSLMRKMNSSRATQVPDRSKLRQMQEEPRYGIYHPRYRIPKQNFGFSKPFAHRKSKSDKTTADVPLFDTYVQRMRDGFEKLPQRGTWSRASKGLQAEWYPMDYQDVEAVRRQGYFHESIGDTQKYSYRDFKAASVDDSHVHYGAGIHQGSVAVSPKNKNRRSTIAQHESRQYKFAEDVRSSPRGTDPADSFSEYKKWYPQEFLTSADSAGRLRSTSSGGRSVPTMSLNISLDSHSSVPFQQSRQAGAPAPAPAAMPSSPAKDDTEGKKLEAYLAWLETQNAPSSAQPAHSKTMASLFGTVN